MKIKLCRIFNIFHKDTIIYALILLLVVITMGIICKNFWYLLLVPVFSICYCYNYSGFLNIENHSITYKDFSIISNYGKGKRFKYVNSEITVKTESIEFHQNIVEKFFNVGHIHFDEKNLKDFYPKNKHTVYGITKFNIRRQQIEELFN